MSSVHTLPPQQISTDVLLEKYAKGTEKTQEDIFRRVAKGVASVEHTPELQAHWEQQYYTNMLNGAVGAGRIMSAAGSGISATYLNCFVQPIGDCIEGSDENGIPGIYEALRQSATTMQKGGGVGYNFSRIRPKGARVKSVDSIASGPCSYMDIFDASCKTIESAGCFAGDTLINTTDGLIPIKTIVESDKEYFAVTHMGPKRVTAKFKNGVKPLLKIESSYGFSVKVTKDHKFAQFDSGQIVTRRIEDIIASDNHKLLISVPITEALAAQNTDDEAFAYVVGAFHGNGSWYRNEKGEITGIQISNNLTKATTIEAVYCRMAGLLISGKINKVPHENTITLSYHNKEFFSKFESYGITKGDMRIPEFILSGSKNVRASYLAGLFDADGHYSNRKSNIRLRMITLGLLQQVQVVLASLGVMSKLAVEREPIGNWKRMYCLGIFGAYAQRAFMHTVTRFAAQYLTEMSSRDRVGYSHPWEDIKGFGYRKSIFQAYWPGDVDKHPNISMNAIVNSVNKPELINTVTDTGWYAEELPPEETYDLEVEDVHLLSGNGFYTSNSRRGAQLGAMNIDHPDVLEFVKAKRTPGRWNNFNVSVLVTDSFMNAKARNEDIELIHPAQPGAKQIQEGAYRRADGMWVYRKINAQLLWETIMQSNYDYAEPGILFADTINNGNNLRAIEHIDATNPCVAGGTMILADDGYVAIESVVDQEVRVWNGSQFSTVTPKVTGTDQEIYDLVFSDGSNLSCTPYHKFILEDGSRVEIKDLELGAKLSKFSYPVIETELTGENTALSIESRLQYLAYLIAEHSEIRDNNVVIELDDGLDLVSLKYMLNTLGVSGNLDPETYTKLTVFGADIVTLRGMGLSVDSVDLDSITAQEVDRTITLVYKEKRAELEPFVYCFNEPINHSGVFNGVMTANCGEQPLPAYGCCDLGPIILTRFVKNPFKPDASFDFEAFKQAVAIQVRFLDSVLDATVWPLKEQLEQSTNKRRIGVGFTGLGNALAMLGHLYYSEDGLGTAMAIAKTMRNSAYEASVELGKEKGVFPLFNADEFLAEGTDASRLPQELKDKIRQHGIRNSHLLSVAPVGTVSLAFADNASNGIEPPFSLAYTRKKLNGDGTHTFYNVLDHGFRVWLSIQEDQAFAAAIEDAVCKYQDSFTYKGETFNVKDVLPKTLVTALSMTVNQHLDMMRVVQPFISTSISKTVNAPADYPFEDFKKIYDDAWRFNLKGVSTYRPNSILGSVLSVDKPKEEPKATPTPTPTPVPEKSFDQTVEEMYTESFQSRKDGMLCGITTKGRFFTEQGEQKFIVTINFIDVRRQTPHGDLSVTRPVEFILTSNFTTNSSAWDATMRFMSLSARSGVPIPKLIENLKEITWEHGAVRYGTRLKDGRQIPLWHASDVAAIGHAIQEALITCGFLDSEGQVVKPKPDTLRTALMITTTVKEDVVSSEPPAPTEAPVTEPTSTGRKCPECGAHSLIKSEGCERCTACGYLGSCS